MASLEDMGKTFGGILLTMKGLSVKIVRGVLVMLSWLPLKFHYFMGDIIAFITGKLIRYRADVVWTNISRSFPDKKYKELKLIYKDFYRHFGEIVAEAIWFSGSSGKRIRRSGIVSMTNPELISECFDMAPSSVTVLSTHCGNWELLGGLFNYAPLTRPLTFGEEVMTVVYKEMSSKVADKVFRLNRIAPLEKVGVECEVESREILRYAIRHKDEKRMYIYPADQAPYRNAGKHPIGEFMHQQTNVMLGSVGLACRLSHSVMYLKMKRVERGRYEMTLIPMCVNASEMKQEDLMRKYYDLLQEEINETPANWLWTHKRWK
jgi:KDO2-lipid IV(A) lauroyltransferase